MSSTRLKLEASCSSELASCSLQGCLRRSRSTAEACQTLERPIGGLLRTLALERSESCRITKHANETEMGHKAAPSSSELAPALFPDTHSSRLCELKLGRSDSHCIQASSTSAPRNSTVEPNRTLDLAGMSSFTRQLDIHKEIYGVINEDARPIWIVKLCTNKHAREELRTVEWRMAFDGFLCCTTAAIVARYGTAFWCVPVRYARTGAENQAYPYQVRVRVRMVRVPNTRTRSISAVPCIYDGRRKG